MAGGLDRREWMNRVLSAAVSLGAAGPLWAAGQGAAAEWKPEFFTAAQAGTLAALGEAIVPGSTAARCPRVIDRMLAIESGDVRRPLVDALAAFDREARRLHGTGLAALDGAARDAMVAGAAGGGALHGPFTTVKEWTAGVYWTSREGLKELGWTGRLAWEMFPGCEVRGAG